MNRHLLAIILSILIAIIPLYYRAKWNTGSISLGSDPQIKYYQIVQMHEQGLNKKGLSCIFPAEKLGFPVSNIPFGYPWAFLGHDKNCYFQYPYLFSLVQFVLGGFLFLGHITYLPIFFFLCNFWLLYFILIKFQMDEKWSAFASFVVHCFTPIFLSAVDYSELTLTNLIVLSILYLLQFTQTQKLSYSIFMSSGFFLALNFQLRPESTIGLIFFIFFYFVIFKEYKKNLPFFAIGFLSLVFFMGIFFLINYNLYDHPLGMRGKNTLNDTLENVVRDYFGDWKADLVGSDYKIGVFQGYPILALPIPLFLFLNKSKNSFAKASFLGGLTFILTLPILSPYRAGVDIFGMRYFETGILLFCLGSILLMKEIYELYSDNLQHLFIYYIYIIFIIIFSYFSYKSDLRSIKHWSSGAEISHKIYRSFQEVKPDIIIHRGLSLSYLIGVSYIDFPQIAIYSQTEWEKTEEIIQRYNIKKVLYLNWEGNRLFNKEIPSQIWKEKFDLNFHIKPTHCKELKKFPIAHFQATEFDCR